jgi:hypothetical protein
LYKKKLFTFLNNNYKKKKKKLENCKVTLLERGVHV